MKTLLLGIALPDSYDGQDPEDIASALIAAINSAKHAGDRYPDTAMVSLFPAPQWLDADVLDRLRHWATTPVPPPATGPEPDERPLIGHMMTLAFIDRFPDEPKYQQQWSGRLQGMAMSGLVWRFPDKPWEPTSYGRSLLPDIPADSTAAEVAAIIRSRFARPAPAAPTDPPAEGGKHCGGYPFTDDDEFDPACCQDPQSCGAACMNRDGTRWSAPASPVQGDER